MKEFYKISERERMKNRPALPITVLTQQHRIFILVTFIALLLV